MASEDVSSSEMSTVASPLTGGKTTLLREISASHLAALYQSDYDIDVTAFLPTETVKLFRCQDTGYEFFSPFSLAGPPEFYDALYGAEGNAEWAYQEEKWEYAVASSYVPHGGKLLDVGSGGGDFLKYVDDTCDALGLETNPFGIESTRAKGGVVVEDSIESHSAAHGEAYDVVTAFQVLEHVAEVRPFLEAVTKVLRSGGLLIIAVPNNDGFVGLDPDLTLNLPPHHMGRWRRDSLEALAKIFGLKVVAVENEPLQQYNLGWYQYMMEERHLPKAGWKRTLYHRLGFHAAFKSILNETRETIAGHTILVVFRKT